MFYRSLIERSKFNFLALGLRLKLKQSHNLILRPLKRYPLRNQKQRYKLVGRIKYGITHVLKIHLPRATLNFSGKLQMVMTRKSQHVQLILHQ